MHSGQIPCPADGSLSPGWAQVSSPSYCLVPSALVLCEAAAFILTHFAEPGSAATSPKNSSFAVTSSLLPQSPISLSSGG